jgi:capsular exopolysaccharide synthesis family protein
VAPEADPELQLRDYLGVLRRRNKTILVATLVVVGAVLAASFVQTPVYQGRAELLYQPANNQSLFNPNTGQSNDPQRLVQTEIEVLKSQPVRAAVRAKLGVAPSVSASAVSQTDVIAVKAQSTDPKQAAAFANAYANAYIEFRRKQAVDQLVAAGKELGDKVGAFQHQIDVLDAQIGAPQANLRGEALQSLVSQRSSLVSQQVLFKQKLDQLQVDAALKNGGAELVTAAPVPGSPVKPRPVRNGIIAVFVGLLLGVGLAFVREHLDDSIKTKDDLDRAAHGAPTLGLIPAVANWKAKDEPRIVSITEPTSPGAEAYRTLRTSVQFLGLERPVHTLQVTSPNAGEGKTTTLANLGVALAGAGLRVVIVCCDLRRPRVHEFFGLGNGVGFTSVLLGDVPLSGAIQQVRGEDRLVLLASGPLPPNPSELLSSHRTADVIAKLQTEADIVLIDTPPVLPVTDAAVLSARVDALLLIATVGTTTRKELGRAVELLRQVDAPLVGTVLNGVSTEGEYGYRYKYYRADQPESRGRRRRESARQR